MGEKLEAREVMREVLQALPDEIDLFRAIRDAGARGYAASAAAAFSRIEPLAAGIEKRLTATPDRSDDALAEENRRLREALEPFAQLAQYMTGRNNIVTGWNNDRVTYEDFRRARAALKGHGL